MEKVNNNYIYNIKYDDRQMELRLNGEQRKLLSARLERSFFIRCGKQSLLIKIYAAEDCRTLEEIAIKYYFCDVCDLTEVNLLAAKRALAVIADVMYRYPKLRSRVCFVGAHIGFGRTLKKLEYGEADIIKRYGLQYIIPESQISELGGFVYRKFMEVTNDHSKYVASTMAAFGLLDAVLLDQNDYGTAEYLKYIVSMGECEKSGYHPKGCANPEYVMYHELGHALDNLCGLSRSCEFNAYYATLNADDIKNGLSVYAATSPREFVAEAFAEAMCNDVPRSIAAKVCELLNYSYAKVA